VRQFVPDINTISMAGSEPVQTLQLPLPKLRFICVDRHCHKIVVRHALNTCADRSGNRWHGDIWRKPVYENSIGTTREPFPESRAARPGAVKNRPEASCARPAQHSRRTRKG